MITIIRIFGLASAVLLGVCVITAALIAGGELVFGLVASAGFPYPGPATAVIVVSPFALIVATAIVKTGPGHG